MKRSTVYLFGFILFVVLVFFNIWFISKHHVEVEEKCEKLEVMNDSLQVEIDTIRKK